MNARVPSFTQPRSPVETMPIVKRPSFVASVDVEVELRRALARGALERPAEPHRQRRGQPGDAGRAHVDAELQAPAVDGLRPCRRCRSAACRCPRPEPPPPEPQAARTSHGEDGQREERESERAAHRRLQAGLRPASGPDRSIGIVPRHPVALPALMLALLALPGAAQRIGARRPRARRAGPGPRAAGPRSCRAARAASCRRPASSRRPAAGRPTGRRRARPRHRAQPAARARSAPGKLSADDARDYTAAYAARAAHRQAPEGQPARRARRGAAQRRGAGLRRAAHGLAREGRPDDRQAQRAVVGRERAARVRAAHPLRRQPPRLAVLPRARACRSSGSARSGG